MANINQRNLNNAFAYDLVPSPGVVIAALKAARRVNDYPTAVRIFEGKQYTRKQIVKLLIRNRNSSKGREHTSIRRILGGIEAHQRRAWY